MEKTTTTAINQMLPKDVRSSFMTLVGKKENCGHAVLKKITTFLNIPNPALTSEVKTADLYLYNDNFRAQFDLLTKTVKERLLKDDTQQDLKDVNVLINEVKKNALIVNESSNLFDTVYRKAGDSKTIDTLKPLLIEKNVLALKVKKDKEEAKEAEEALKLHYMKKYGLV